MHLRGWRLSSRILVLGFLFGHLCSLFISHCTASSLVAKLAVRSAPVDAWTLRPAFVFLVEQGLFGIAVLNGLGLLGFIALSLVLLLKNLLLLALAYAPRLVSLILVHDIASWLPLILLLLLFVHAPALVDVRQHLTSFVSPPPQNLFLFSPSLFIGIIVGLWKTISKIE